MKTSSLFVRLILLACLSIFLALAATTIVLNKLFFAYFQERIYSELDQYLKQVTANITVEADGEIRVTPLPEPRFDLPFSGLYWQITEAGKPPILSRSLWGQPVPMPAVDTPGQERRADVVSADGVALLALEWQVLLGQGADRRAVAISVAIDKNEVIQAAAGFRNAFVVWLSLMFLALIAASWVQVRLGLAPLETLRKHVGRIRAGLQPRLDGRFPREVQPLVNEVNVLLDLHTESLASARARAGDLAHGLKTPLTVMLTLADELRDTGNQTAARAIREQVESMRHFVERELARARTRAPAGTATPALATVEKMVSVIRKFPADTPLEWQIDVPETLTTPFDEHDLSELLGNTLDNARKWAAGRIRVTGGHGAAYDFLTISDDGPGVPDEKLSAVLSRGERLDDSVQGQGLGLAICADMTAAYGADLILSRAPLGGLAVEIRWPVTKKPAQETV